MNKSYRVIWNKSTQTWQAVAEFAKSHGKSSTTTVNASSLVKSLLTPVTFVLTVLMGNMMMANSAFANEAYFHVEISDTKNAKDLTTAGKGSLVAGEKAVASGTNAVVIGHNAKSATGNTTVAVGYGANATADNAIAMGNQAQATGQHTVAVGVKSQATQTNAVAIGNAAQATHANSVALGSGSVTTDANTVSVGSTNSKRKITNVASGEIEAGSSDAVTGGQLYGVRTTADAANTKVDTLKTEVGTLTTELKTLKTTAETAANVKNYFHVNASKSKVETGTSDNLDAVGGAGGAKAPRSLAAGVDAQVESQYSIAIGDGATITKSDTDLTTTGGVQVAGHQQSSNSLAVGTQANVTGQKSVAIGYKANVTAPIFDQTSGVAIGDEATVNAKNSVAIGHWAVAKAGGQGSAMALGDQAEALNTYALAMGTRATASNDHSTAIAKNAKAYSQYGVAIGVDAIAGKLTKVSEEDADTPEKKKVLTIVNDDGTITIQDGKKVTKYTVEGYGETAIGKNTLASGNRSTAIGTEAQATGERATAISNKSQATGDRSTAIGNVAIASNTFAVALGDGNKATGHSSTAIGQATTASGTNSTAIGKTAESQGFNAIAMGTLSKSNFTSSTAIGNKAEANANYALAVGDTAVASGGNAVAIGQGTTASGASSAALGKTATATGSRALAFGSESKGYSFDGVAMGTKAEAGKTDATIWRAIAIGNTAKATANDSIALGSNAQALENTATSIGRNAINSGSASVAIGDNVKLSDTADRTVVIGRENTVTRSDNVILGSHASEDSATINAGSYDTATGQLNVKVNSATVGSMNYAGFSGSRSAGVVSIGRDVADHENGDGGDGERRLINVGAGEISARSTDAINGSQLYAVANSIPATYTTTAGVPVVKIGDKFYNKDDVPTDGTAPDESKALKPADVMVSMISPNANSTTAPTTLANVAGNLDGATKKADGSFTDAPKTASTGTVPTGTALNNAATVGDVLNAGWNLKHSDGKDTPKVTDKDFVRHADNVLFANGNATTATIDVSDEGKTSTIKYDVNVDDDTITIKDGKLVAKQTVDTNTVTSVISGDTTTVTADTTNAVAPTYKVEVNKATVATTPTDTASSTDITVNTSGKVIAPTADANKNNHFVTAQGLADVVNNSGFTLKTSETTGGTKVSGTDEVINPGETVEMVAGKNLTVKQEANGKVTYATANDVSFNKVTSNSVVVPTDTATPSNNPITINKDGISAGNKAITNVAGNLADAKTATVQPDANKPADLASKSNNAATVGDVLNAGWNLQGNGKAVDTVVHNDTVDFVNGKGTTVTVENKDGKNTIKVDSAIEFVNTTATDTSTPSTTAKLTGTAPVQLGNVASGVRNADGTTPTGKELATAITNAKGNQLTNAVNVGDLQAATNAAKTEVTGSGLAKVTSTTGTNGQTIYNVEVAKANAPTVTRGSVTVADDDKDKVMTAGHIATAITNSEKTSSVVAATGSAVTVKAGAEDTKGNTEYTIDLTDETKKQLAKASVKTKVTAGDGVTVNNAGTDEAPNYTVSANTDGTTIKVEGGKITANTTTFASTTNGSVDVPVAPNALVTAQTVANAINSSGFNLQANGDTASLVKPGNTVQFIDGNNIEITRDGNNVTVATADDVEFNTVTSNEIAVNAGGNLVVGAGSTVDMGGNQITNVKSGLNGKTLDDIKANPTAPERSNAATIGDLTQVQNNVTTNINNTIVNNIIGQDPILTYDVSTQTEKHNITLKEAINNMNKEGIRFFHTNDGVAYEHGKESNAEDSSASGKYATAVGYQTVASGEGAVALGNTKDAGTADAQRTQATGKNAIAIGTGSQANAENTIAIGTGNIVTGKNSGAIGDPSTVTGNNSYSLGNDNTVATDKTFVVGNNVTQTLTNSVILGDSSSATAVHTTANGGNYTYAGANDANVSGVNDVVGVVSVGKEGQTRQIQNVAAGVVSADSTDAINGSQLYDTHQAIGNLTQNVNNRIDDVEDDANAGVSSAMAMAALPQAYLPGKSMLTGGMATYNGEGAVAVGLSKLSDNGRWVLKISGSADTRGNAGAAVGAGFHF